MSYRRQIKAGMRATEHDVDEALLLAFEESIMRIMIGRLAAAVLVVPCAVVAVGLLTISPAAAAICTSRTAHDINHDGKPDVIIGQPFRTLGGKAAVGAASLMRGASAGLTTSGSQFLRPSDVGEPEVASQDTGEAAAVGFFDSDCFADAIVGEPGTASKFGTLLIYKGSASGLVPVKSISGDSLHANVSAAGFSFAVGDFNHDGYDDVAVGAYNSSEGGGVAILYGSSTGLNTTSPAWFDQSTPAVPGTPETGDQFGYSLAAGDFNGDHFADLAIGVPGESLSGVTQAGDVTILYGTSIGLSSNGSTLFDQNSTDVPGTAEAGDRFGFSLAAGDVTGDGRADLVVGDPNEAIGSVIDSGEIVLLKGSSSGITGAGSQVFTQNTSGVPGTAEAGDEFGSSVTVGDFNGDGKGDVAVGVPDEGVGNLEQAGCVDVIKGTSSGLTGTGSTAWDQDTSGVPGTVESGDEFGFAVLARAVTGGTRDDLLVGARGEDSGAILDNGSVTVLPTTSSGLTGTGSQVFTPADVAGGTASDALFGSSIS